MILSEQEIKVIARSYTPLTCCFKPGFKKLPCNLCAVELSEIQQGICPECHGEGEQGVSSVVVTGSVKRVGDWCLC